MTKPSVYTEGFIFVGCFIRLITLSEEFYNKYCNCVEVLQKQTRPYVCLEMKIRGTTFAIPFRHHIRHKHAFITYGECGLDYTKAVVIADSRYIENTSPQIEQNEFNAIKGKESKIHKGMNDYIKLYKKALQYKDSPHYSNIIRYSSLQYFERFL